MEIAQSRDRQAHQVFDLLRQGGQLLLELPYVQRRARLLELELHRAGVVVPANSTDTAGDPVL